MELSEEEKKAIEYLRENLLVRVENEKIVAYGNSYKLILLNLINKQQKEIEREKQYSDFYEDLCNTQRKVIEENKLEIRSLKNKIFGYKQLYINKDKIRELIINKAYKDSYEFKTISIEDLENLLEENNNE